MTNLKMKERSDLFSGGQYSSIRRYDFYIPFFPSQKMVWARGTWSVFVHISTINCGSGWQLEWIRSLLDGAGRPAGCLNNNFFMTQNPTTDIFKSWYNWQKTDSSENDVHNWLLISNPVIKSIKRLERELSKLSVKKKVTWAISCQPFSKLHWLRRLNKEVPVLKSISTRGF